MADTDRKPVQGKFVWFDHVSNDSRKAQKFYNEVLGWKVEPHKSEGETYEMIQAGDTAIGGYTPPSNGDKAHWVAYIAVDDVDKATKAATANGAKVTQKPSDIPNVGRWARIEDPQGAEISFFKSASGADDADAKNIPTGRFFWNELHTTDPDKAITFYEKVVGYTHKSMDMGQGGAYHVIGSGGVDRGGVTHWLEPGVKPHWLPYVHVDDADATVERAKKAGGKVLFGPENIPNVGRFGVLQDPTGAVLAVMKPNPNM